MPSVPLISASPSLAASSTGVRPAAASASAAGIRVPAASRTSPSPISASAQCDSGARSPEQPSEPYSRTTGVMPWVSSPASSCAVSRRMPVWPVASVESRSSISAADHLALDLGAGAGGVRAHQRPLQLGAHLGRDVPGRERAEAGRDAVRRGGRRGELLDHRPGPVDRRHRVRGQLDRGTSRATATTSANETGPTSTLIAMPSSNSRRGPRARAGPVAPVSNPRLRHGLSHGRNGDAPHNRSKDGGKTFAGVLRWSRHQHPASPLSGCQWAGRHADTTRRGFS